MSQSQLRDEWYTPDEVFLPLQAEFGPFDLDAAASAFNTKAPKFYSEDQNSLEQPWHGRVWCNPPYRKLIDWCRKAWHEVTEGNADLVVMLLPNQTSTAWFHDYATKLGEVRFLRGRVSFGGTKNSPFFGSVVVIFRRSA